MHTSLIFRPGGDGTSMYQEVESADVDAQNEVETLTQPQVNI